MTLASLLEWWNFIFALPLAAGLMLGLGLALSGLIGDLGPSKDAGVDEHGGQPMDVEDVQDSQDMQISSDTHDAETSGGHTKELSQESYPEIVKSHEHDSDSSPLAQILALFGLGIGLPLTLGFPTLMILWGSTGLIANGLLSPMLKLPAFFVPISILLSLMAMAFGGRLAALLFRRAVGNTQPLAIKRGGLVGSTGYAAFEINAEGGAANVKDPYGNVHRVVCRTLQGAEAIEAGTEIIIVRFEPEAGFYYVEENPFAGDLWLPKAQTSGSTGEQTIRQQ